MARCLAVLSFALALALVLAPAQAGDANTRKIADLESHLAKLDSNKDGRVSKPEFLKLVARFKDQAKAKQWLSALYDDIDREKKGITREQFKQYLETKSTKK